jgi:hypothetical protein
MLELLLDLYKNTIQAALYIVRFFLYIVRLMLRLNLITGPGRVVANQSHYRNCKTIALISELLLITYYLIQLSLLRIK